MADSAGYCDKCCFLDIIIGIFYNIYTEEEMRADPEKRNTGLFYFRGKENTKFAILNAGGGFMYVGAMQDSFPYQQEILIFHIL